MINCTLINHENSYNLSIKDGLWSVITGFSGLPYAVRHAAMSKINQAQSKSHLGHDILYLLQSLPVIGALTAIVEKIIVVAYTALFGNPNTTFSQENSNHKYEKQVDPHKTPSPNITETINLNTPIHQTPTSEQFEIEIKGRRLVIPKSSSWQPRALSLDVGIKKMWKNTKKAIEEHISKEAAGYANIDDGLPSIDSLLHPTQSSAPLIFKHNAKGLKGRRPTMEDAHFFIQIPQGVFFGVCDGHGGKEIANYASKEFQKRFSDQLISNKGNVHQTFESLIHEIHQEVIQNEKWNNMGTTVVISFIDERTNLIYTATLGDSEANIYRHIKGKVKAIPLSNVRDWSYPKEATRVAIHWNKPEVASEWPLIDDSKMLRSHMHDGEFNYGVNVSRAIGDKEVTGDNEKPLVIHKPKITVNKVQRGDKIIVACDGLRDFVSEPEIIEQISAYTKMKLKIKTLSEHLAEFAIKTKRSGDNVSVLAIDVQ